MENIRSPRDKSRAVIVVGAGILALAGAFWPYIQDWSDPASFSVVESIRSASVPVPSAPRPVQDDVQKDIAVGGQIVPVAEASTTSLTSPTSPAAIHTAKPVRISIPAIGVDAPVVPMGITTTGILDTPHNFVQTGWYESGTIPGNIGSAVIDAHVDSGGFSPRIPGVFKNLKKLKPGDYISIVDSTGAETRFVVDDSETYLYADVPTGGLFNENDGVYLKLVTCDGQWLPSTGTYSRRLIVSAKLAP